MVEKKRLLEKKPSGQQKTSDLSGLDAWVKERDFCEASAATDLESPGTAAAIDEGMPEASVVPQTSPARGRTDKRLKGKQPKYPHRVTVDMDSDLYERLRAVSYEDARPKSEIVRDAIEFWLSRRVL